MTPVLALSAALLAFAPTPSPAPSPSPTATPVTSWLGASLGETEADVRSMVGKPREVIPASVGALWRYDADGGNVTLDIFVDQGQVVSITARVKDGKQSTLADPLGGALGMSATALQTVRGTPIATYDNGGSVAYGEPAGVRWFYTLDGGVVTGISVSKPLPPPPAAQVVADAAHDGSSIPKAFIVHATTQADASNAEITFLHTLSCEKGGVWQISTEELVTAAGGYYDLLHAVCSTTKTPHDFYFDVGQSYGK